ncbi:MAG: AAA family ATPase [Rubrobacteraceae bacterium]|nr:AAA family ATPase [Rubrobacteraceae bacterium]MDQ3251904.1 AAA family ATPase [Actinomycetota bacterium]MDQ3437412.1 AAA family ATPase [Actinomycetota bacterium]
MNCPRCQMANPEGAKFCLNCGNQLEAQVRIDGERRYVTVLFADVVDSTGLGERLDPEQFAEIMNGAFAFLNSSVKKYDGTVARLLGDAILAFFGAPVAHEDDAERAVRAGLDIQAAAREYAGAVRRNFGVDFDVRVGINTGLAVLAAVGDEIRTEYTAMGDTTNVAARLQSAALPGTVLISADTYHLVKQLFELRPRGGAMVKGKSAPIVTYEVLAPKAVPGKVRGLEGLTSPLVGRAAEFERVNDKLNEVRQGRGAFVTVIGEAGLGKSRLLAEISESAKSGPQVAWLEGRALSYGQAVTYYPWRQVIREAIGAQDGEAPEVVREKLHRDAVCGALPEGDPQYLEVVLSVESDATRKAVTALEGDALVEHITRAARGYLRASAELKPTVIVLDDLHWADTASLDLLLGVADLVEDLPLLITCLLRPDKGAPSWSAIERVRSKLSEPCTEILLEPLDAAHSKELLGNLLYIEDLPESVRNLILDKAEGNPFFVEEVIRTLIDSEYIVQENSHWRATREIVNVTIPDTLTGVLSARIDRLPENTKHVAQTAAVLGRIFAYRALMATCAAAPLPEQIDDVEPHLGVLTYEELVRERVHDPELEYIFKHALTQEAAYELLLIRRRKELHRRAGEVLEHLYPEQRGELAPALAHHYRLGEEWQRAADYAMQAGAQAVKVYAMREALAYYDNAYDALNKIQDASPEQLCDAILGWTPAALVVKPYQEVVNRLEEAEKMARDLDDEARLARVLHWIGNAYISNGFPSRGMPALFESYQLAERLGDERLTLVATFWMTAGMIDRDPRAGLEQMDYVVEAAHKYRRYELEAHGLAKKAMAHARLGEFAEARDAVERAYEASHKTDSVVNGADVALMTSLTFLDMGDVQRGLEYSRRGTEQALSAHGLECAMFGHFCTGLGNLHSHNPAEAQRAFESALRLLTDHLFELRGSEAVANEVRAGLAVARFLGGDTEAINDMESTLANADAVGDDYTAAFIAQALGEGYTQLGDFEHARQHLDTALAYYRRNEMKPYLARVLKSSASLHEAQGHVAEAERELAEAGRLTEELSLPPVHTLGSPHLDTDEPQPAVPPDR